MADLQKGYQFSGTSPNNSVTAEKLNTLVDGGQILTGFYSEKAEVTSLDPSDLLLMLDSASGQYRKIQAGNAITAARGKSGFTNLVMSCAGSNTQITITADEVLMVRASNGTLRYATSFSNTVDITVFSGGLPTVNGRDFTSAAANTWYYVHAISDGANDRAMLSSSAASPTLPAGYLYSCLLGAVRNDAASVFQRFVQHGCRVALEQNTDGNLSDSRLLNPKTGASPVDFTQVAADVNNNFQAVRLAQCVPPNIVAAVSGILGISNTNSSSLSNSAVLRRVGVASKSGGALDSVGLTFGLQLAVLNAAQAVSGGNGAAGAQVAGFMAAMNFEVPVIDSQQIVFASATGAGAAGTLSMRIGGYTLAL